VREEVFYPFASSRISIEEVYPSRSWGFYLCIVAAALERHLTPRRAKTGKPEFDCYGRDLDWIAAYLEQETMLCSSVFLTTTRAAFSYWKRETAQHEPSNGTARKVEWV